MKISNKKAFTLIEMAIVITIIGIVVGSFINLGSTVLEKRKISTTQDELESIKTALISYAAKHGRLPYPDTDGNGYENDGDDEGNGDTNIADCLTDDCELPYLDLKVKAKDNFGMAYNYDVWDAIINTNRDSFCSVLQYSYIGNSLPKVQNDDEDQTYSVAATILSKGEDKVLTGENANTPEDRIYEMKDNKYNDTTNNDLVEELTVYDLLGQVCDLVPSEIDLTEGLTTHYKFDGNSNDEQGNYDGTDSNSPTYTGNEYLSTGTNAYVATGMSDIDYENWTISIWLKRIDWESEDTQQAFLDVADNDGVFEFFINKKELRYRNSDANLVYDYDGVFTNDTWHHFLVTQERKDATTVTVKLYVDGVNTLTADRNWKDLINITDIGRGRQPWLNADIDEFRLYNRVLTNTEVGILYGQGR